MNIDHLKLFVRIAAKNNISSAGEELGLSAAVASAHIKKLESDLGVRLVHRTTRQVSLTEEGRVFLPHAEEILAGIDAAKAAVGIGNTAPSGTLRVAAPASFGRMHLIPALPDFLKEYPQLVLDFQFSDRIVDLVEGGFDIAVRNAELNDSTLVARKLANDMRIVCASPAFIKNGMPKSPEDLKNFDCVQLTGMDNWHFKSGNDEISVKPNAKLNTDNGEAMRDACVLGLGIAINATWSVYEQLRRGELVPVLQGFPLAGNHAIWAVYPSSRQLAPKVRAFIDFFAGRFSGIPYWDQ